MTTGRPFTSEIRSQGHTDIADYIHNNHGFTDIVYKIRNGVIHREGIMQESEPARGSRFTEINGKQIETRSWDFHGADLTRLGDDYVDIARKYSQLNDSPLDYDPVTEWGLYSGSIDENADHAIFEPYRMIKMMADYLFSYIDEFLRIIGHENVLEQLESNDSSMLKSVEELENRALTLFVLDSL